MYSKTMKMRMIYTDQKDRLQILTNVQAIYLDAAERGFDRGWGGLSSTLTVRLLEARGLIQVRREYNSWRVVSLLPLGASVLDKWKNN